MNIHAAQYQPVGLLGRDGEDFSRNGDYYESDLF